MGALKPQAVRACEDADCLDDLKPGERRHRCPNCGLLVCGWCWNHVHAIGHAATGGAS